MKPLYKAVLQLSLSCFLFLLFNANIYAQPPSISYQAIITGLSAPVDLVNAHDGSNRLFVVQQGGLIKVWNGTTVSDFIDLSSIISTGGERGLLSMAFHPGFNGTTNRYFFVYYTNIGGNVEVSRYETVSGNPNAGDAATQTIIITIPHPTNNNHNGGKLNFGSDGYLYFATGDGGGANDVPNNAQNGNVLLGKMIRIDINTLNAQTFGQYEIPADNPYKSDPSVLDEIYNLGLRNPFRWSFDRNTGDMWIGDVGQDTKEEIDFRSSANTGHNNFGWSCYEGSVSTPNVTDCTPADNVFPVLDYDNPNPGSSAVTGGYVYRGNEYTNFRGYYIAADFYSGTMYFLWPNGSGGFNSATQTGLTNQIAAFGEGEDGTLYAVSQASNSVYKLIATGGTPLPVKLKDFSVQHFSNYNELKWTTSFEQNTKRFYIEYSTDPAHFISAGTITASENENGSNYSFQHYYSQTTKLFYRLSIEDADGKRSYSSVVMVLPDAEKSLRIYPTIINNRVLTITSSDPVQQLQLLNNNGAVVFEKNYSSRIGASAVNLPALAKGMYVVQVIGPKGVKRQKIIIN